MRSSAHTHIRRSSDTDGRQSAPPPGGDDWPPPRDAWPPGGDAWPSPSAAPQPYPAQWPLAHPAPQRRNSTAPAYIAAALFIACAVEAFAFAAVSWDGTGSPWVLAAVIGLLYSGRVTGNVDFGITMTMTVACMTITLALVLLARLAFARWILAGLGGLVAAYYACAVLYLIIHGSARLVPLPVLALLSWSAATVMALLPYTARAMRRWTMPG